VEGEPYLEIGAFPLCLNGNASGPKRVPASSEPEGFAVPSTMRCPPLPMT